MFDMTGPLMCAGALMGAGREYGAYVERPPNGFDCDVGGEKVADCALVGDIRDPCGGALIGLCWIGDELELNWGNVL